jgi:hypothetical protein
MPSVAIGSEVGAPAVPSTGMPAAIDVLEPEHPKRVAMVASNPAVSEQSGWPVGFWWAELTHPYWELTQHGYQVEVFSPEAGGLEGDSWSDPRDAAVTPAWPPRDC